MILKDRIDNIKELKCVCFRSYVYQGNNKKSYNEILDQIALYTDKDKVIQQMMLLYCQPIIKLRA